MLRPFALRLIIWDGVIAGFVEAELFWSFLVFASFFIHLVEIPRYSLVSGNEEQLIKDLDKIASSANRSHDLTLEKLQACGALSEEFTVARNSTKVVLSLMAHHFKLLYSQVKLGFFITNMQLLWFINGFAYPMYAIFLPYYLMTRGAASDTMNMTYRDMAIVSACGAGGTFLACVCAELIPKFGKKGSMIFGNTMTAIFLFCYTQVRTQQQNLAFSCCVYLTINFGYATLFSYTTEILPSQFPSTATSGCVYWSRIAGVLFPFVAYYTDTSSNVPIFICAAMYLVIALITILLAYELVGQRLY